MLDPKSHLHIVEHEQGSFQYPTIMKALIGRVILKALSKMPEYVAYEHMRLMDHAGRIIVTRQKTTRRMRGWFCKYGQQRALARHLGCCSNRIYHMLREGSLPKNPHRRWKLIKLAGKKEYGWLMKYDVRQSRKRSSKQG